MVSKTKDLTPATAYLLRFVLSVCLLAGLLVLAGRGKLRPYVDDQLAITYFVGKLNFYHDVFYVLLIGLLLLSVVLWIARKTTGLPWWIRWLPAVALAAMLLPVGFLPLAIAQTNFHKWPLPFGFWIAALYLSLNLLAVLFHEVAEKSREKIARIVKKAVGLSDCLAPLLVWRAYRGQGSRKMAAAIVLPYGLLAVAQLVPWFLDIKPAEPPRNLPPAFHFVSHPRSFYQLAVDPADGQVVVSESPNWLRKIDLLSGRETATTRVIPFIRSVQGFDVDLARREVIFVDAVGGNTFVYDLGNLTLKRQIRILQPHPYKTMEKLGARTLLDPRSGALFAFDFIDLAAQISREGDRIVGALSDASTTPYVGISDVVIDAKRPLAHAVSWNNLLIAWDLDQQRVVRTLKLPSGPDRLLYDEARDRLIIPLPVPGKIFVVDAGAYRRVAVIDALPGVRVPALSQPSRRLYLGCVTPYVEIRSLDDYSLIDRLPAPAWTRWLAVDEERQRLLLVPYSPGLYWIDLTRLQTADRDAALHRADPFFYLFRWTVGAANHVLRLHP